MGEFQNFTGQAFCHKCPYGKCQDKVGQISCDGDCPAQLEAFYSTDLLTALNVGVASGVLLIVILGACGYVKWSLAHAIREVAKKDDAAIVDENLLHEKEVTLGYDRNHVF